MRSWFWGSLCACLALPGGGAPAAGEYAPPVAAGIVSDGRICEASGITPSGRTPGLFWIHNDSGDPPRIFATKIDGTVIAEVTVANAAAVDWEDIEAGPGPVPGERYLYIADTGNNCLCRADLRVYRIPEPALPSFEPGQKLTSQPAVKLRYRYPDGAFDCEGLAVHPVTGEVLLFAKKGAPSGVYRLTTLVDDGQYHAAERVGTLSVPNVVTGAAFSPDGLRLALRTYAAVHEIAAGDVLLPLEFLLAQQPSVVGAPPEPQGEAVCYGAAEEGIYTIGEGNPVPIHYMRRDRPKPQPYCVPGAPGGAVGEPEEPVEEQAAFLRGDSNDDAEVDVSDAFYVIASLFLDSRQFPCEDAADATDDGWLDLADAILILEDLFSRAPRASWIGTLGPDLTDDSLTCVSHTPPPAPPPPPPPPPRAVALIGLGDPWRYHGSPAAPPDGWKDTSFDDAAWAEGPSGLGYGDGDDATVVPMQGGFLTLYARRSFALEDPSRVEGLVLVIDYDDGFVAYLNGTEVARRGLGSPGYVPAPDQKAALHEAGTPESISICREALVPGANVLAVEVHNASIDSSDLTLKPELVATIE